VDQQPARLALLLVSLARLVLWLVLPALM